MSTRFKLLIVYFVSMLGLSMLNIFASTAQTTLSENGLDIVFTLVSQVFCMGVIPLVGRAIVKPRKGEKLSLYCRAWTSNWRYRPPNRKVWLLIVPLALSFYFLTQLMARVNTLFLMITGFTFPASGGTVYRGVGDLFMWLAVGALLPAVFEELTHRGLLLEAAFDRGNELQMILLSGLLFACMHTNVSQIVYTFVGGCVLAFITVKTGSIYPAMVLHFSNNAISHIQEYAEQHPEGLMSVVNRFNEIFTQSTVGLLGGALFLAGNAVLFLWLLSLTQKWSGRAEGLEEKWLLRGKKTNAFAISVDLYRPFGKATLTDNLPLFGVLAMTATMTVFTFVWGVLR